MDQQSVQKNKWVRRAAWSLGGLAALWAVSWLAVPPLLKHQAQKMASEKLGRKVSIGGIDFKPWSLELTASDLAMATADGRADQLRIKRIYIDGELQSLLRLAPVVDAVVVDEPVARLTHLGGGRYDVDDLVQKLAPPADQPASEPAKFALYNLALNGGSFDFVDTTVGKTHTLRDLRLAVPFLSNLEAQRNIHTDPRLAFKLNGSAFDTAAETTPFAQTRKTDATLKFSGLDLKPYLGYIPPGVPVRLLSAVLDADLKMAFEQNPEPAVRLSGVVQARDVKLVDGQQQDLLAFEHLKLNLADVRPLAQSVKLSAVELTAPTLSVHRTRDGRLNLELAAAPTVPGKARAPLPTAAIPVASGSASSSKTIANNDRGEMGKAKKDEKTPAAGVWKLDVAQVAVRGGRVDWTDDTTAVGRGLPARLGLRDLTLDATGITVPLDGAGVPPIPFQGSAALQGAIAATRGPASAPEGQQNKGKVVKSAPGSAAGAQAPSAALHFSGTASAGAASVTSTLSAFPLGLAAPYLAQVLEPALGGTLHAAAGLNWQAATQQGGAAALTVKLDRLALDQLALTQGKTLLASVQGLELTDALINPLAQTATLGKLAVTGPKLKIERDASGRWMFEKWLRGASGSAAEATPAATAGQPKAAAARPPLQAKKEGAPWKLAVNDLLLSGGTVGWSDAAMSRPVAFDVSALRVQLQHFSLDGKKPAALQVSARLGAGRTEPGRLSYRGTLGLNPVATQGSVDAVHLPVHAFEPYFGDALNIELLRADASFKGTVRYADSAAGPRIRVSGDTAIEEFRANSVPGTATGAGPVTSTATVARLGAAPAVRSGLGLGEELLAWKALSLRGVDVALAPGTATTVDIKETALSDFFARVIIHESGRINLQDILKSAAGNAEATAASSATATVAASPAAPGDAKKIAGNNLPTPGNGQNSSTNASSAAAQAGALDPVINVGPVSLLGGRVHFSDRFIQPNYSANLTELTGKLSAFSSVSPAGSPQLADLELRGRAEGTASLEILGKLNPLAKPLALDIKGKVRDLELAPLTPYSVKYAGHGIERGKLSVDVAYLVLPNGQLTASNKIILNQLTFGDKVEGAPASLPVKLAVALLADRNGVIDINLPISGSLSDPQFRLGPVIFKVIVNLIVKAITAPFSLLASAFGGGGDELSVVPFAPGSAVLGPQALQGLDQVAKALAERPALKMTVVGTAGLDAEREGYKRERLQALVQAEKRRAQVVSGAANGTATVVVSAAEYPELLKAVYKRADMPKPRNLVGLTKDIPQPEMEALLLANIPANEALMRELATQRGVAVRDYLASRQLPLERLFLGAPKTGADKAPAASGAGAAASPPWSPRAELGLSTR